MKRFLLPFCLFLFLAYAATARAGEVYFYAGAGEITSTGACSKISIPSATHPHFKVRCTAAGGSFLLHANVPQDIGSAQVFSASQLWHTTTAVGATGDTCYKVDVGSVNDNENGTTGFNGSPATLTITDAIPSQNIWTFGSSLTPLELLNVAGANCIDSGPDCRSTPLLVRVTRLTGGSCATNSASDSDFLFLRLHYD